MDTPGRSHRQNNGVFLKTSPVSSLLRAGSSDFLSLAWDLLSFLCEQLSPPPARRSAPSETRQVVKAVFHTHLSEACPELSQGGQQPSWSPASCLPAGDTGERFPAPVQSPHCSCSSWNPEEEAAGLPSGDSAARVRVHELGGQAGGST